MIHWVLSALQSLARCQKVGREVTQEISSCLLEWVGAGLGLWRWKFHRMWGLFYRETQLWQGPPRLQMRVTVSPHPLSSRDPSVLWCPLVTISDFLRTYMEPLVT